MDDVQDVPVLDFTFDKVEQSLARDVVEIFRDILFQIILGSFGIGIDDFANFHRAKVRSFALLSRIRVADTGAEEDGSDDLKNDVLDDPVRECHGVAEVALLAPLEDVAGTESGEPELTRA